MKHIKLFEEFKNRLLYRLKKELPPVKFYSSVGSKPRAINYYCFCKTLDEQHGILDILKSLGYEEGRVVRDLMDEESVHCAISWNTDKKTSSIMLFGGHERNPLYEELKFDDYFEKDPRYRGHFGMKKFGLT